MRGHIHHRKLPSENILMQIGLEMLAILSNKLAEALFYQKYSRY